MKKIHVLFIYLLLASVLFGQNYKQVKVQLIDPQKDVQELAKFDFDLEHAELTKENELIFFVSDEEFNLLSLLNYKIDVLIDDWFEYFNALPKLTEAEKEQFKIQSKLEHNVEGFGYGSLAGYYNFNEVVAQLDSMKVRFPNLITTKQVLGYSIENRPVYLVKISDNPDIDEDEPEVLYTSLLHAREPAGLMAVMYFMYYLLENYATNPSVQYLVNNRELYFIPVINPDGYEYNRTINPNGGGMWRKNRKNNGGSYGVDLNRNFGPYEYWNAPNGGSSTTPSSDTYRGTAPFSEPETQIIRDFTASRKIKNSLFYHTYSNLLIYPYGALGRETPDSLTFREFARDMTAFNGYVYGTDLQTVNYSTRGGSDDFLYDGDTTRGKIFGMTPEVGSSSDGFWPQQSRIFPLAIENLHPNLYYAWVAGEYVKSNNITYDRQYFNPGDNNVLMNVELKNKGLSTGTNLNCQLTSLSEYITVTNGTVSLDSLSARSVYTIPVPFSFDISPLAPIELQARFALKTFTNGIEMSTDTIKIIIGTPQYMFVDTTNNPLSLWTITSSPTTPQWGANTSTFYSAPNSYTDSPVGNYVANATVTLTSTNTIDLTSYTSPVLSFWTKYDIETKWDCGVVFASSNNGTTWIPLTGNYTKPASGSGKQTPAGIPIYDGLRNEWVKEEISLAQFGGNQVKLRFELRTDGSVQKDGWYIDDIGVYIYTVVPVELVNFYTEVGDNSIYLNWATVSELNNKGFEIQKKSNSENESWTTIGFVEGKGTSAEKINYTFTDEKPSHGKIQYRLKQIDFDGTFRIYGPLDVNFSGVTSFALEQNYPNPFNPVTVINYQLPENTFVTLKVYDILGNEVKTLVNENQNSAIYKIDFDGSNLASGMYIYKLTAGNYTSTKKMMLLR